MASDLNTKGLTPSNLAQDEAVLLLGIAQLLAPPNLHHFQQNCILLSPNPSYDLLPHSRCVFVLERHVTEVLGSLVAGRSVGSDVRWDVSWECKPEVELHSLCIGKNKQHHPGWLLCRSVHSSASPEKQAVEVRVCVNVAGPLGPRNLVSLQLSLQLESEDHLEAEFLSLGGGQSVFSQGL